MSATLSLAHMALMKCVLLIFLIKNNTKFYDESRPIFVQFLQCWDHQRSQPLQSSSKGTLTQGVGLTLLSTPHSSQLDCNKISLVHHPVKYFMQVPIFEITATSAWTGRPALGIDVTCPLRCVKWTSSKQFLVLKYCKYLYFKVVGSAWLWESFLILWIRKETEISLL